MSFKKTVRLSDKEITWLSLFGSDFHSALSKIKLGCIEYKDLIAKMENIEQQIIGLKKTSHAY